MALRVRRNCCCKNGNASTLPTPRFDQGGHNITYDALPQQGHLDGPLSAADAEVDPVGPHFSAPTDLGFDPEKKPVDGKGASRAQVMLQGFPSDIEAHRAEGILEVGQKEREGVSHLPLTLGEEPERHHHKGDVGSTPECASIYVLGHQPVQRCLKQGPCRNCLERGHQP